MNAARRHEIFARLRRYDKFWGSAETRASIAVKASCLLPMSAWKIARR